MLGRCLPRGGRDEVASAALRTRHDLRAMDLLQLRLLLVLPQIIFGSSGEYVAADHDPFLFWLCFIAFHFSIIILYQLPKMEQACNS
jgi:hypothetical protein